MANYLAALRRLHSIERSVSQPVLLSLVTALTMSWLDYGNVTLAGFLDAWWTAFSPSWMLQRALYVTYGSTTMSHICFETCTGCKFLNTSSSDWLYCFPLPSKPSTPVSCQWLTMVWWVGISLVTTIWLHTTMDSAVNTTLNHWRLCMWNSLPSTVIAATSLVSFKSHLKTYLFHNSYF